MDTDRVECAFDARRLWVLDAAKQDLGEWRIGSLIFGLRAGLIGESTDNYHDYEHRVRFLLAVVEELMRRGFDADSLVRYGLPAEVITPVFVSLLLAELVGDVEVTRDLPYPVTDIAGWRRALGGSMVLPGANPDLQSADRTMEPPIPVMQRGLELLHRALGPLTIYVQGADLRELFDLTPPSGVLPGAPVRAAETPEIYVAYRWIVERFAVTFLSEWSTESLLNEYQWMQGSRPAPCAVDVMVERNVNEAELNAELARRMASGSGVANRPKLSLQMRAHAKALLSVGRRSEAAALFEFAWREDPTDADALNNMAFCLIPDQPGEALDYLDQARAAGYRPASVNVYNRMCCHIAQGRPRLAVTAAAEYRDEKPGIPVSAVLWTRKVDGSWVLLDVLDTRREIELLASELADQLISRPTHSSEVSDSTEHVTDR